MLKAIVVDDEELSIKRLTRLLSACNWLDICRTFQDPGEAYEYAQENPIDVAFLDISMPHIHGMKLSALLAELNEETNIVFVTGYEDYAVQAFEVSALDYMMKPVDEERLGKTLEKIRKVRRIADQEPAVSVFLFNGLKIYKGTTKQFPIKLRGPKTEELFVYLLYKRTARRDEIIEKLWPTLSYDKALHNLNSNLYFIRKSLGMNRSHTWINVNRNEINVDTGSIYCDLYEFEEIFESVTASGMAEPARIDNAIALYVEPILQGRDYAWSSELAHHYEQLYLTLLHAGARHSLSDGDHEAALHYFNKMIDCDRLREDIYHEVIKLYIALDRRTDAIRCFGQLQRTLSDELGIAPSSFIVDLMRTLDT